MNFSLKAHPYVAPFNPDFVNEPGVTSSSGLPFRELEAHLTRSASVFHRYVNGKTYMEDVANALEEAKEEIFITDWW